MRRSLWQIFWAFVVACLVGAAISLVALKGDGGLMPSGLLARLVTAAGQLAIWAIPGTLMAIALSEWLGLRNVLFHMIAGGATAILGALLKHGGVPPSIMGLDATGWSTPLLTMGVAGGFAYWAMRGHKAGEGFPWASRLTDERRCWPCVIAGLLAAALPLFLAAVWASHDGKWIERIRDGAERTAATQLGKAGYDWATLKIDDAAGRIVGQAPNDSDRSAAFTKAQELLQPMTGLPGVFSVLINDIKVAGTAPQEPAPAAPAADRTIAADAARAAEEAKRAAAEAEAKHKAAEAKAAEELAATEKEEKRKAAEAEAEAKQKAAEAKLAEELAAKALEEQRKAAEAEAEANRKAATVEATSAAGTHDAAAATVAVSSPATNGDCLADISGALSRERFRFGLAASYVPAANDAFLERLAQNLNSCSRARIRVDGHTDSVGSAESNMALSLRRAETVRRALIAHGVAPEHVTAQGFGETAPLWPAETPEARSANRRIEFTLSEAVADADAAPAAASTEPGTAIAPVATPDPKQICQSSLSTLTSYGKIEFRSGSSQIAKSSSAQLVKLATAAKACASLMIRVDGHTDGVGSPEANQALSERRAANVREALIARGVSEDRISSLGFGESQPLYEADTPEARARNRRIEFTVQQSTP